MSGMVQDSWSYVIAAYVVTWVVLGGYALYLWRTVKEAFANSSDASASSSR